MKSTRLSFNIAISRNTLKRFWPLWAAYLAYLIMSFPVYMFGEIRRMLSRGNISFPSAYLESRILGNAADQARFAVFFAVVVTMFLFGYLCSSRGNTLMNSLPLRRDSLFLTVCLTGLVPSLGCQLLALLAAVPVCMGQEVHILCLLQWLACSAMSFTAFYGFAVFCAMLTGNIIIIPAVYFVLNLAAVTFEGCLRSCLAYLVYGMEASGPKYLYLSPIAYVLDTVVVEGDWSQGTSRIHGFGMLAAYCVCGILFVLFALLLYRRRRMESVSDFVAIPVLRPIFRVCMGLGTAVVFAAFMFSSFFGDIVRDGAAGVLMAALMLAGAILGWIAAEMMIRRSLHVFPLPWKGLAAVCMACVLTVLAAETDLTGYERRVPDPGQVESVSFLYDTQLKDQQNIRELVEIHREIIGNKELYDGSRNMEKPAAVTEIVPGGQVMNTHAEDEDTVLQLWVPIRYHMKNGRTIQRTYTIFGQRGDVDLPETMIGKLRDLVNTREGVLSRMTPEVPVEKENIRYAAIHIEETDGRSWEYRLTPPEAEELWKNAMLPDGERQDLGLYTICDTEENLKTQTNLTIHIEALEEQPNGKSPYWGHEFRVFTSSQQCLDWIEENTNISWITLSELYARREELSKEYDMRNDIGA